LFYSYGKGNTPHEAQTLIVGINATYPPYESYNQDGEIEGFDVDVATALAGKLGLKLNLKEISFDALILALKQGKIDIIMSGMSITSSRQQEIAMAPYQGETVKHLTLAFWKEMPLHIKSLEDLDAAAVQVGTYQEAYLNTVEGIEVKALEGTPDLILDLQYGKSQAVLFEPHIANAMKAKFPEIQLLSINLPEKGWVLGNGIGIKKDNDELLKKIEAAVRELKEQGVIHKLEQKWFGEGRNAG
jgi:arginine transport system substrate-binding protein